MPDSGRPIAEIFSQYFQVDLAKDADSLDKVQFIRYRVYCEEFGYESNEQCPGQRERDEYDDSSVHCLITHRPSGTPAACVRMVPTPSDKPQSALPFEKHCGESLNYDLISQMRLNRERICEVSRLAVDRSFRRRPGEHSTRLGNTAQYAVTAEERRSFPFIATAAYLAATSLTRRLDRPNVFAMMEPFLPRLLRRGGIHFTRVGTDTDYHGTRAAYFTQTERVLDEMPDEIRDLYLVIEDQLFAE
jgi:N-acyl amino acid synthase of PEP-CTERM/exosortase system